MAPPVVVSSRLERFSLSDFDLVVTFDGGARDKDGRVAGSGAVLWGPEDTTGQRQPLAHALVALPDEKYAQVAEAWGAAAAIMLLLRQGRGSMRVLFAGDNLAVVRYGAAQGFLRNPALAGPLHTFLSRLSITGHLATWIAVRRKHNKAADLLATLALELAVGLRDQGIHGRQVTIAKGWPAALAWPK